MAKDNKPRTTQEVRRLLNEKSRQIEQHLNTLKAEAVDMGTTVRETISRHPLAAVGGALTAGVLIGLFLARNREGAEMHAADTEQMDHRVYNLQSPQPGTANRLYMAAEPLMENIGEQLEEGADVREAVAHSLQNYSAEAMGPARSFGAQLFKMAMPAVARWAAGRLQGTNESKKEDTDD